MGSTKTTVNSYFYWANISMVAGLILGFVIGGIPGLITVALLIAIEVSLSFDNAVVNAAVLKNMTEIWQDRFIKYGIPISVFGMRLLFPIVIVALASGLGMYDVFTLAVNEPEKYQLALESNKNGIYLFGGSFLALVGLDFFLDKEKDNHWAPIEKYLIYLHWFKYPVVITTVTTIAIVTEIHWTIMQFFAVYGGLILYSLIGFIGDTMMKIGSRAGIFGFLYLELLDASFSFDGVVAAFALTNNIFIIMIGLGVGAFYIRSLTISFVRNNTLDEYEFLEHSAMYAIVALAVIMITKIFVEVPELLTAFVGIGFISLGFAHSYYLKNK